MSRTDSFLHSAFGGSHTHRSLTLAGSEAGLADRPLLLEDGDNRGNSYSLQLSDTGETSDSGIAWGNGHSVLFGRADDSSSTFLGKF